MYKKIHNEELYHQYSPPNIIRVIKSRKMGWPGRWHFEGTKEVLAGRPEGKRPLGRPRRSCEDNIKMNLQAVGWGGMHWICPAQGRDRRRALVNEVMNF